MSRNWALVPATVVLFLGAWLRPLLRPGLGSCNGLVLRVGALVVSAAEVAGVGVRGWARRRSISGVAPGVAPRKGISCGKAEVKLQQPGGNVVAKVRRRWGRGLLRRGWGWLQLGEVGWLCWVKGWRA